MVKDFDSGACLVEDRYGKRNIHDKHIWKRNRSSIEYSMEDLSTANRTYASEILIAISQLSIFVRCHFAESQF
jgi:hypothetical protein